MIRSVKIENFMSLRDVSLNFEPFTLLIGPNASGKTSVLRAIQELHDFMIDEKDESFARQEVFCQFNPTGKLMISVTDEGNVFSVERERNSAPIRKKNSKKELNTNDAEASQLVLSRDDAIANALKELLKPHMDSMRKSDINGFNQIKNLAGLFLLSQLNETRTDEKNKAIALFNSVFGDDKEPEVFDVTPVNFLMLYGFMLGDVNYREEDDEARFLYGDGSNLALILEDMALEDKKSFESLIEQLKSIVPLVKDVYLPRTKVNVEEKEVTRWGREEKRKEVTKWGRQVGIEFINGSKVTGVDLSEGTLRTLAVLTAIHNSPDRFVCLIDDIDQGLHPKAQKHLVENLRELMKQRPGLQIIATTHSPYLLDEFKHDEIRMSTTAEDGSSLWAKMTEHPGYEKWKEMMMPGEFWTHIGEDWIKELPRNKQEENKNV